MQVLSLQVAVSILALLFGIASVAVARRIKQPAVHHAGWMFTGLGFTLVGVNWVGQNVFASMAFFSGPDTALWDSYISYAAVFDHSRTVALIGLFSLMMLRLNPAVNTSVARHWSIICGGVFASMIAGGVFGWLQSATILPQYYSLTHYPMVALLDVIELLVVLSALFLLLIRDHIDRILWAVLSIYAFFLALNAVWTSGMIGLDMPGSWAASPLFMHGYRAVLMSLMLALTVRRGVLARRGIAVPGLLDSARPSRSAVPRA